MMSNHKSMKVAKIGINLEETVFRVSRALRVLRGDFIWR
jgi:hypothetical protein